MKVVKWFMSCAILKCNLPSKMALLPPFTMKEFQCCSSGAGQVAPIVPVSPGWWLSRSELNWQFENLGQVDVVTLRVATWPKLSDLSSCLAVSYCVCVCVCVCCWFKSSFKLYFMFIRAYSKLSAYYLWLLVIIVY